MTENFDYEKTLDVLERMATDYRESAVKATLELQGNTNERRGAEFLKDLNQAIGANRAINEVIFKLREKHER